MAELKEECVFIRLYFKWGKKNAMKALTILKVARRRQALERTRVSKWFWIVSGVNCAENAESLGCPTAVKWMKLWVE
jgi:hypothetical protein